MGTSFPEMGYNFRSVSSRLKVQEKSLIPVPIGVSWPWPNTTLRVQDTPGSTLTYALVSIGRKPGFTTWKDQGNMQARAAYFCDSSSSLLKYELVSSIYVYEPVFTGVTLSNGCWD